MKNKAIENNTIPDSDSFSTIYEDNNTYVERDFNYTSFIKGILVEFIIMGLVALLIISNM